MRMIDRVMGAIKRPVINTRVWGIQAKFTGNDIGAFYTTAGRGGQVVQRQWQELQGAIYYTPQVAVQAIYAGQVLPAGSYGSQPLATLPNSNTAAS